MNRSILIMSKAAAVAAFVAMAATSAHAQNATEATLGALTPPPEISNIVSIDAHNVVLVESQNPDVPSEPKQYSLYVPRHIYSGAIARLFGGSIISTESMVIPESARRSNFGSQGGVSGIGNGGNSNNGMFNTGNFNNGNSGAGYTNMNQFNRALGLLDRPSRQTQVGISQ